LNAEETLDFYGRLFKLEAAEPASGRPAHRPVGLSADKKRILRNTPRACDKRIGLPRP